MDITGTIKMIGQTQKVSDKFSKKEFVLTDNSTQYAQHISFQLTQQKCDLLDKYKVGDEVKVHFNIRGKEWTSPQGEIKYFVTLEAWRVESGKVLSPSEQYHANDSTAPNMSSGPDNSQDDLPFRFDKSYFVNPFN